MQKPGFLQQNYLLLGGLILLAAGLPVSKFLTGLSQFVLIASFLFEGNFREKIIRLKKMPVVWAICGIWIMHIVGLFYSENIQAGLWDSRMKLPILILTVVVASSEAITWNQVRTIFGVFIFSVLTGTIASTAVLAGFIERPVTDIRDIFIFHISHIRFALFLCLCIFFMAWQLSGSADKISWKLRIIYIILICWFTVFLFIAESVTGLSILFVLSIPSLLALGFTRKKRSHKILILVLSVAFPLVLVWSAISFFYEINKSHEVPVHPGARTELGNEYKFYLDDYQRENGYRVWIYLSEEEMREAWNKKSMMPYDSTDKKSQPLGLTLIRYLTSLGLRKDAAAVNKLTVQDIHAIESGVANVNYRNISSFKSRLMELNWEIQQAILNQNPSGHSAVMRIEFWKTGFQILGKNFWTGVGTGDLQQEFNSQYEGMNSPLDPKWRLRAHNQFLSIALAFGIFGFIYFLFALIYPVINLKKYNQYLYMIFMGIFILSMFTEDTLETQAGATFYAFFNSLLLFYQSDRKK